MHSHALSKKCGGGRGEIVRVEGGRLGMNVWMI